MSNNKNVGGFRVSGSTIADEIKSRCNIVDIVGRYVELKRSGSSYKGLCPFHSEKTPSFNVSESRQFFYCFGCGASGDVISFLMKIENIDFHTAVSKLAEEYGIDMDRFGYRNEGKKNEIYEMNREAAVFFYRNLTEKPNPGYEYMKKRGLNPKTIARFGIGFAEDSWHALQNHLLEKKYSEEMMMQAGLLSASNGKRYDKFRNRVMFPIFNTRGKVIGFGGRTLGDSGPKYLNSPESSVFSKKNNLYGLNLTRNEINSSNCAILVEGYMDLVSLYRNGVRNVAASLGTALTEQQCALLKRYTQNVVLSYDADAAGQKAALRGIELLRNAGISARVLHISDGKDPDEFITKNGKEAFLKLVDQALPYADYRISVARGKYDIGTPSGGIGFLREIRGILADLSPVEADVYIKKIAAETHISESAIRREVNETAESARTGRTAAGGRQQPAQALYPAGTGGRVPDIRRVEGDEMIQMHFIKLAAVNPDYLEPMKDYEFVFEDPAYARIYNMIKDVYLEDSEVDINKVSDNLLPEDDVLFRKALERVVFPENSDQVFRECVEKIRYEKLQKRQNEILEALTLLTEEESDRNRADALTKELIELQRTMQNIKLG